MAHYKFLDPGLDLDERSASSKMEVTTVKAAYQPLTSAELGQCRSHSMKSLDENLTFTWLIAHYGARIVLPLLITTQRMPRSLTDHQKLKYLRDTIKPVSQDYASPGLRVLPDIVS